MGMKWSKKALPEVIPPRICITFRRASFWSRSKSSKIMFWELQTENTVNTEPWSHDDFSENFKNHENRSKLDPYSTNRDENRGFWIPKLLRTQWDHWGPPKLPYKNQNRLKIQWTPPTRLSTKFGHQPYLYWSWLLLYDLVPNDQARKPPRLPEWSEIIGEHSK